MSEVKSVPLSNLVNVQSGFAFKSKEYSETGHFLIRISNVQDGYVTLDKPKYVQLDAKTERFSLDEGDVLVSLTGNIGRVARIETDHLPAALNQRVARLTVAKPEVIDNDYLFWFLNTAEFRNQLCEDSHGVAQQNVSPSAIKEAQLFLPSLSEQRRIVSILDEAFGAIAKAKQNAEKNLANAKELFDSYLDRLFTRQGEGWEEKTVGELVEDGVIAKPLDGNHGDIHPKKADFVSSGVPFIMASHLVEGMVDQVNCHFISKVQADSLRKGFAKDGDVLLSHKGTIGRTAILATDYDFVVLTPQVTYYRIQDSKVLNNAYLYFFFQCPDFQDTMTSIAGRGSTRAYIGITMQLGLSISYPTISSQVEIAQRMEKLADLTAKALAVYQRKLAALDELKQSILQKAFAGQLTNKSPELELVG